MHTLYLLQGLYSSIYFPVSLKRDDNRERCKSKFASLITVYSKRSDLSTVLVWQCPHDLLPSLISLGSVGVKSLLFFLSEICSNKFKLEFKKHS